PNSSRVYMSPGYTGCSNVVQELISSNFAVEQFGADVKSLDLEAFFSIGTINGALHIMVNEQEVDIYGKSPVNKHFEAGPFNLTIWWSREIISDYFAVQFDLGDKSEATASTITSDEKTTRMGNDLSTTSTAARGGFELSTM
ncbi:hypothetical protein PENTCL1PPCAC_10544, partial [Pristionchus entomophagus]